MNATAEPITESDIRNSQWWEAPWPLCWRAQTQWIDGDQWVLLCAEGPAMHGGMCRMAHQINVGGVYKVLLTQSELPEYLNRVGWKRIESPAS